MIPSITSRLLWAIGIVGSVLLVVAGGGLSLLIWNALLDEFDSTLASEANTLAIVVEHGENGLQSEFRERPQDWRDRHAEPHFYQIRDQTGQTVERSEGLGSLELPRHSGSKAPMEFIDVALPDGRQGRAVCLTFEPHREESNDEETRLDEGTPSTRDKCATITVARETRALTETFTQIQLQLSVVFAGALGVLIAVAGPLVKFGLRPLLATSKQIEQIDERSLDVRLDVLTPPTEIRPVVVRLNRLLSRLDAAFQRERVFSANVAHELRTPLAGIHATIDVALSKDRPPEVLKESLQECLQMCRQTEELVEHLLMLSRIDAGRESINLQKCDVRQVIRDAWAPFEGESQRKRLTIHHELQQGLSVQSDVIKLKSIATNLLENAVTYVNDGGSIDVRLQGDPSEVTLRVTNTGSQLTQQEAELAFNRFWRGEAARSDTGKHSGLGLAICRELASLLNGRLSATSARQQDFTVEFSFPPTPV